MGSITSRPISSDLMESAIRQVRSWRHNVDAGIGKKVLDVQIVFHTDSVVGAGHLVVEVGRVTTPGSWGRPQKIEFDFRSIQALLDFVRERTSIDPSFSASRLDGMTDDEIEKEFGVAEEGNHAGNS